MPQIDPTALAALPAWMQVAIFIGLALGVALSYFGYMSSKKTPPQPSPDFVLQAGSFTDVRPIKRAAESIERIEEHAACLAKLTERRVLAEEKAATALDGILDLLANQNAYERGLREGARGRRSTD